MTHRTTVFAAVVGLALSLPVLANSNPRTVVALEDTHFLPVSDDDPRDVLIGILGDLASFHGASELEVDEDASFATLKAQVITLVSGLEEEATDEPCGGEAPTFFSYEDADGIEQEASLCADGTRQ